MIHYIRTVAGEVIEKGICQSMADLARLRQVHPGQYSEDDGKTPLAPIKPPKPPKAAKAKAGITLEEVADALLGDKKALAALKRKRKKD